MEDFRESDQDGNLTTYTESKMQETRIVSAVGHAHRHGKNTIKKDVTRFILRILARMIFFSRIPPEMRNWAFRTAIRLSPIGGASKGNSWETDILGLLFTATPIANIADNASSSPLTSLYFSAHTADPGEAGTQLTSEIAYTGYTRIGIIRSGAGFTVTGNTAQPVADVNFPVATAGTGTVTHFGVGTAASGAGKLLYTGPVTPNIGVSASVTPQLAASGTTITED